MKKFLFFILLGGCIAPKQTVYVRQPDGRWKIVGTTTKQEIRKVYNLKDNAFRDLGTDEWKAITQDTIVLTR